MRQRSYSRPGSPHRKTQAKLAPFIPSPQTPYARSKPVSRQGSPRGRRSALDDLPLMHEFAKTVPSVRMRRDVEIDFDSFMLALSSTSISRAIETFFCDNMKITNAIYWEETSSTQSLSSEKLEKIVKHGEGLVGNAFLSRSIVKIEVADQDPNFDQSIDPLISSTSSAIIFLPLYDYGDALVGMVQLLRKPGEAEMKPHEEGFILEFQKKFKAFSKWILRYDVDRKDVVEILQLMDVGQFMLLLQKKMESLFGCVVAEIWEDWGDEEMLRRYGLSVAQVEKKDAGIVRDVFKRDEVCNLMDSKMHSSYYRPIDGKYGPMLATPVKDPFSPVTYVIMLRGRRTLGVFTNKEEHLFRKLAPVIIIGFANARKASADDEKITSLETFIREFVKTLPTQETPKPIEELVADAMKVLISVTNADRGTFYEVNHEKKKVQSVYAKGWTEGIKVDFGVGHAGIVAETGKSMNVFDVQEDEHFNREFDKKTGFQTKSLMTVPIINTSGQISAVIQLLNKFDTKPFGRADEAAARMIGTMVSCLTENSSVAFQLKDLRFHVEQIMEAVEEKDCMAILKSVHKMLECEGLALYIADKAANRAVPVAAINLDENESLDMDFGVVKKCIEDKSPFYCNDTSNDIRFYEESFWNETWASIYVAPLISDDVLVGVLKIVNRPGGFSKVDRGFLGMYSRVIVMVLERIALEKRKEKSQALDIVEKYVSRVEATKFAIPKLLKIPEGAHKHLLSAEFCTLDCNEAQLFQIIFQAFSSTGIMRRYDVPNAKLLEFVVRTREMFNDCVFNNWTRSIDVLQFILYEFAHAKLITILRPQEVFALIIAGMCTCMGSRGTNNRFEVNSTSEIGLLYPPAKVIEGNRCSLLIQLAREVGTFDTAPEEDKQIAWKVAITLLLMSEIEEENALEPAQKLNKILRDSLLDLTNDEHRLILMTLCYRAAVCSVYCRPRDVAEKWLALENEEMFQLGKRELDEKLPVSSPHNIRSKFKLSRFAKDRAAMVIPTLQAVCSVLADLNPVLETAKANFEAWRSRE